MKFHPLLKSQKFSSFSSLERAIEQLPTTKEKGDAFEDFVFAYLNIKSQKYQINEVYKLKDAPIQLLRDLKIELTDSGVDGIFIFNDGSVAGYQVKFRTNRKKPSYDELAKFWIESRYTDYRYTIANCYSLTALSTKEIGHMEILVGEFEDLEESFFDELFNLCQQRKYERKLHDPYGYQTEMITDVVNGFKDSARGKLIAACGVGKTLTALWITEKMECQEVLFLAPSLALIKQTLEEWAEQTNQPFEYLCVCSDKTVHQAVEDFGDIAISELGIPVSTDSAEIQKFLRGNREKKRIIFSTYQSLDVLSLAVQNILNFSFDLAIFDEAHRTAGARLSELFSLGLDEDSLPAKKRLFMTATERMLMPRLKQKAAEEERTVFSMDDEEIYGPTFHRLNFGRAINLGVISDYKIVVAAVREKEIYDWIKNNTELQDDHEDFQAFADIVFTQILLSKAIKNYDLSKVLSFHSSIDNSKTFLSGVNPNFDLQSIISRFNSDIEKEEVYVNHVNGSFSAGRRKRILDEFKVSKYGIVSNSRCLTEGVDVPVIDSIFFVDPKNSLIDIVQACGRALRTSPKTPNKTAYILLPILIPEGIEGEDLFQSDRFESIYNVVQALRDQDDRLVQWIDILNQQVAGRKYSRQEWTPIDIDLPQEFDLNKFEEGLLTRIATVNSEPTSRVYEERKTYGRNERTSSFDRLFRTIGDYSVESFQKNLVDITVQRFDKENEVKSNANLKINNNNVSHTFRLGLIEKLKGYNYKLTPLGIKYKNKQLDFETLFKQQVLKYYIPDKSIQGRVLFPYRIFLQVLLEVETINYLHFAFPLCRSYDSSKTTLKNVIEDIIYINNEIVNLKIINETNQKRLLEKFNQKWGTSYTYEDIWVRNTTLNNQWIYFKNHLTIFDAVEWKRESGTIEVNQDKKNLLRSLLKNSNRIETLEGKQLWNNYADYIILFIVTLKN